MQPFMGLHTHYIIAIQQPVQLLASQGDHLIVNRARPFEAGPLQAFLPQAETVTLSIQDFDPVAESYDIVHLSY